MATGFVSNTGNEAIDQLFSRGGMASMLTTVWLVLGALSFAAVMEHAGSSTACSRRSWPGRRRRGRLILAVNASGIGLNVIAGDQYVADVLPARMFRDEFAARGLAPQVLSRAVEDSGTVTSVLVPWNTCGAYISGVLGVPTSAYLPFCFFNILSPILDVLYGFVGFKVPTVPTVERSRPPTRATGASTRDQPPDRRYHVSDQTTQTARAHRRAEAAVHAPIGLHDPVRADRARGDRDVVRPGRHVRPRTRRASRSPARTTRSSRTPSGSSSTR